ATIFEQSFRSRRFPLTTTRMVSYIAVGLGGMKWEIRAAQSEPSRERGVLRPIRPYDRREGTDQRPGAVPGRAARRSPGRARALHGLRPALPRWVSARRVAEAPRSVRGLAAVQRQGRQVRDGLPGAVASLRDRRRRTDPASAGPSAVRWAQT